jgi:hypothetical protein
VSVIEQNTRPSSSSVENDVPPNWGSRLVKKTAIFGLPRLLTTPWPNATRGLRFAREIECVCRPAAERSPERLQAEEDEVGGAGDLDGRKRRLRGPEDRGKPEARGERPERLARRDSRRREHAAPASTEQRVPSRQRRVLPRCNDHDGGDAEEG